MGKILVILGVQWGDEGKGKVVDLFSKEYDIVVRYQGGSNAGHTVYLKDEKFITHLLPTGLIHKNTTGVISQGVVLDLKVLKEEVENLERRGLEVRSRLLISERVNLVFEYHKVLDKLFEGSKKIGTTLRGIGPAYMFKCARKGIRACELFNPKRFYSLLEENVNFVKDLCRLYNFNAPLEVEKIYEENLKIFEEFKENFTDTSSFLLKNRGKNILFEGAQGTLLDLDIGTYPYVTSSNSSSLGLSNGAGLPPKFFKDATFLGVSKAYTTRVGEGPFPTEAKGEEGEKLRELGGEYGATTGRPRRCGWLDLVALKHSVEMNSIEKLVITKLDVLDYFEEIKVCVAYELDGEILSSFPSCNWDRVKPVYKTLKGWKRSTKGIRRKDELPKEALEYLKFVEDYLGVEILMISTGPKREEFVELWKA